MYDRLPLPNWIPTLVVSAMMATCFVSQLRADERPSKPNIVLMMADDMGIGDTSAYLGVKLSPNAPPIGRTLRTPNLDRFSESAIVFTDGYAPASMCSSTRYSLLTGRFAHRSYLKRQGWLPHGPNTPMIGRALKTLPEMLQTSGYRTAGVGKYHVGMSFDNGEGQPAADFHFHDVDFTKALLDGPTHHGFDEYFGVPGNTEDPLDTEPRILIRNDRFTFTDRSRMKLIGMKKREGRILAAPDWDLGDLGPLFLQEAQAFITRQSQKEDEPFFLYYVPCANHLQTNPGGDYAVPDEIGGTPIKGQSRYSDNVAAGDREDMVLENDVAFGKLIESLKTTDDPRWPGHRLIENTLVIFTSDNGPNVGDNLGHNQESGGLRGKKAKIWEGGIRVPLMVSWPAVLEGGKLNRSIVTLTDLYATLAHVVGHSLAPEEAQDSHDVFAYWKDTPDAPDTRPRVFTTSPPRHHRASQHAGSRRGSDERLRPTGFRRPARILLEPSIADRTDAFVPTENVKRRQADAMKECCGNLVTYQGERQQPVMARASSSFCWCSRIFGAAHCADEVLPFISTACDTRPIGLGSRRRRLRSSRVRRQISLAFSL